MSNGTAITARDRNSNEYSTGNRTDESHLGPEEQVSQRNQAHSVSLDENEDDIGSDAIILDRAMY